MPIFLINVKRYFNLMNCCATKFLSLEPFQTRMLFEALHAAMITSDLVAVMKFEFFINSVSQFSSLPSRSSFRRLFDALRRTTSSNTIHLKCLAKVLKSLQRLVHQARTTNTFHGMMPNDDNNFWVVDLHLHIENAVTSTKVITSALNSQIRAIIPLFQCRHETPDRGPDYAYRWIIFLATALLITLTSNRHAGSHSARGRPKKSQFGRACFSDQMGLFQSIIS
jgi:hypothetical protein